MHSITNLCVLILEQTNEIRSSQEKKLKIVFVLRFYMAIKPKKNFKAYLQHDRDTTLITTINQNTDL